MVSPDTSRVHTSYSSTASLLLSEVSSAATLDTGGAVTGYKTKRQLFTDGLGRLAKVVEDPDTLAYATTYGYTPLNQLAQVTQGSQTRNFYYDSLKRLTRAVNPESDAICYGATLLGNQCVDGYDGNGNLLKKKDANNVAVTMTYDALNRPLTSLDVGHGAGREPDVRGRGVGTGCNIWRVRCPGAGHVQHAGGSRI
ncbi:MAG TPA: RHS repeat domain-containing protein [Bryobacteraceae bacterium]|nr:RHS repeat domain-containing protein [Bryobacteraceae bacterium]